MQACIILLTLAVSPSTTQAVIDTAILQEDWEALVETVLGVQNTTNQLIADSAQLIDGIKFLGARLLIDIEVLKSRQAVAGAIQGVQIFLFLAYLTTIAVCCLVKRCRKQKQKQKQKQKEAAKTEFEILEMKLQASRSRRRAAAAARSNKQTPQ